MTTIAIIPSTVGFHWEEVFAAYRECKAAGWQINFYTIDGKPPTVDPNSVKHRPLLSFLGLGVRDSFSPESTLGEELKTQLMQARIITDLDMDKTDAIYIPGGHGALFDVNPNELLHTKIFEAYTQNKIIGAVCHGTSCLAFVKKEDGSSIVKGKKIIGFLDVEDDVLEKLGLIDQSFLPLPYRNEQKLTEAGADITTIDRISGLLNPTHCVVDLPFVTGIGPKATERVIKKIIELTK